MFERFDDPVAFRPDQRFHATTRQRSARLRRGRLRLVTGVGAVVVLVGTDGLPAGAPEAGVRSDSIAILRWWGLRLVGAASRCDRWPRDALASHHRLRSVHRLLTRLWSRIS